MIHIDGSQGEGGGQILRTAVALSALTGESLCVKNIRAGRSKPGLRPQHLASVRAVAQICDAHIEGDAPGSRALLFEPGRLRPGEYHFNIGTAGSTSLLLQAVYLPLALADGPSQVVLTGGTHVKWSPSYDFLERQWAPWLAALGLTVRLRIDRYGFYPEGEGRIRADIQPWRHWLPLNLADRGRLRGVHGLSAVANLPESIARRQLNAVNGRLPRKRYKTDIRIAGAPSRGRGTFVALFAEYESGSACYVELGEIGRPAEKVGDAAARAVVQFDTSAATIDEYLADQILLPLALMPGKSRFSTNYITRHLLTNVAVVKRFLDVEVEIDGLEDHEGTVRVRGRRPEARNG